MSNKFLIFLTSESRRAANWAGVLLQSYDGKGSRFIKFCPPDSSTGKLALLAITEGGAKPRYSIVIDSNCERADEPRIAGSQSFVATKIVSFHSCPPIERCAVAESMMWTGLSPIERVLWVLVLMRYFSCLATDCSTNVMSIRESIRKYRDTPLTLARMTTRR